MSFSRAVSFVLAQEGSDLVSDPHDAGGISRYGIALKEHPELTAEDIRTMTPERASQIYAAQYWLPVHGEELPDILQLPMLDCAVLQGPGTAIRCLQAALYVLPEDGIAGPATLGAARRAVAHPVLSRFAAERIRRLAVQSTWGRFGAGWAARVVLAALEA